MDRRISIRGKKRKLISFFVFCLTLFIVTGCKEEKIKEPELIWQRDFGVKIHRFKLHRIINATDFPIMSVETEDELIIFDKKGNEIIRRQIPRLEVEQEGKRMTYRGYVILSDNGEYILEGKGVPEFSYDLKYTTVDGRVLWEEKNFHGLPVVSPDGSVVVLLDTKGLADKKGKIKFYDTSGKLLKQHFADLRGIETLSYDLAFSQDGSKFVLNIEQWIKKKGEKRRIFPILLFDKTGNLLWRKEIVVTPGKPAIIQLLISPYGDKISYSSDKYIYTVDNQGRLLWRKEFHNLFSFSPQGKFLLIGRDNRISIVNAVSGEEIWMVNRKGYPIISPDETLLAIIGRVLEPDGKKLTVNVVRLADKRERLILKKKYSHPFKRRFQFSSDSKYLYFVEQEGETKLSVYKLTLF